MVWQRAVGAVIRGLRKEEQRLAKELARVQERIAALISVGARPSRPTTAKRPRKLSPEGRAAIARAARKRWAQYRARQRKAGAQ
jgi:hypothetical protein